MKKNKINALAIVAVALVVAGLGFISIQNIKKPTENNKIGVVATSFPSYDLARAIAGSGTNVDVKMLLKPGAESHHFEPTPQDIIAVKKSRLFIYNGGDSDSWVEKILKEIDPAKTKVVKLTDLVELKEEEQVEGMEHNHHEHEAEHDKHSGHEHEQEHKHKHHENENHKHHKHHEHHHEIDEHVWTSPVNAIKIVKKLEKMLAKVYQSEQAQFAKNSKKYINELSLIDKNFRNLVKSGKRKTIIVADRFPFRYFADEYGLKYFAAFPGCSEQTEASPKTIAFLTEKVKSEDIPVIFKIELSDGKIAKNITEVTGAKILVLNSAHNITAKEFEAGKTYVDIMKENLKTLKKALN